MTKTKDKIIQTADTLFYQNGFEKTSFADIAQHVGISRGNFYHHFKTKDDILDAVISYRLQKTTDLIGQWESKGNTPRERLLSYIHIVHTNQEAINKYGCPLGTLSTELAKLNHTLHGATTRLFSLFKEWLKQQFLRADLPEDEANRHALHILSWSQGVATMMATFQDDAFVSYEVQKITDWLDTILPSST